MKKKSSKAWRRSDVSEYWAKHDGQIDSIVDELHDELMTRTRITHRRASEKKSTA